MAYIVVRSIWLPGNDVIEHSMNPSKPDEFVFEVKTSKFLYFLHTYFFWFQITCLVSACVTKHDYVNEVVIRLRHHICYHKTVKIMLFGIRLNVGVCCC